MQGKIIKGIAGFYYVDVVKSGVYECRAKGIFRKEKKKPLVGDNVRIEILDEENMVGNLVEILPRKNELIRPAVANVDQALVIFAATEPKPNVSLLDRFLITMERQEIPAKICINKKELVNQVELASLMDIYSQCGYEVILTSAKEKEGLEHIQAVLSGKTTVVAGPSGVGKSSLTNLLQEEIEMPTGEISHKLGKGRHTTRHSQLIRIGKETYLMDTPGFTSFYVEEMEKEELKQYFPEFHPYEGKCKYQGCAHLQEPKCAIKQALLEGKISQARYDNYTQLYQELKEKRRY